MEGDRPPFNQHFIHVNIYGKPAKQALSGGRGKPLQFHDPGCRS